MEYISGLCVFFGQICIKYCKYSTPLVIDITMDQFLLESVVIVLHALVQFFLVVHFIMWKVEAEDLAKYQRERERLNAAVQPILDHVPSGTSNISAVPVDDPEITENFCHLITMSASQYKELQSGAVIPNPSNDE
ncbi:uncharacterized protein LOC109598998 [Aethina tumida]|uniref:uncharacterized protein LOC109598998 n=1 Tax=Aethina tumida TaxID=116153 RepID=UPI00096B357A|nr:uncharacterized protein LOC109598998 [Aethina tumida]